MPCGCDGQGCTACAGSGVLEVRECPARWCGADAFVALNLVEHAMAGAWPEAGGLLDQPLRFVEAVALVRGMQADGT